MTVICIPAQDDDRTGYGRMGAQLRAAFRARGIQVDEVATQSDADTVLVCQPPQCSGEWKAGQRVVLYTMYETTMVPPALRGVAEIDMLIVPCEANVLAFSEVHPNVVRVPLGVDDRWKPVARPAAKDTPFTFLTAGSTLRKGCDAAVAAFQKAFPTDPDVRLIVKTVRPKEDPWLERVDDPRIQVVDGFLSADEEMDLYASAHVFVGLARGEGFGLMPLQAIRQGCPTILSAGHGHDEFADLAAAVVPTTLVDASSFYDIHGPCGKWWEPDIGAAADAMHDVRRGYTKAVTAAKKAATAAGKRFTWDATVDGVLAALGGVDALGTLAPAPVVKERAAPMLVAFTLNERVRADIGPWRIDLAPDVEHWHTADVRRVLADAGKLASDRHDDRCRHASEVWG